MSQGSGVGVWSWWSRLWSACVQLERRTFNRQGEQSGEVVR